MDSLIFELEIIFHFQLFLSANVRHSFSGSLSLGIYKFAPCFRKTAYTQNNSFYKGRPIFTGRK